jgi:hypothetical protein
MCIPYVYTHSGALIVQSVRAIPNIAESIDNASSFCEVSMDQSWTVDSVNMKSNGTE